MKRSTLLHSVVALISLSLLWMSTPALAQHGGGHGGGGGGGHAGGGGGGFHGGGGSYGGFHGGGYGGGYSGGYHGGSAGAYAGRGSSGGMRGAALGERSSSAGRPWSWEGHSSHDASPGWHQFASGNSGMSRGAGGSIAGRAGESSMARAGNAPAHAAVADGNWHSFNASNHPARSTAVSDARVASVTRSSVVSNGFGGRGNLGWRGGWRGGFGWGWGWPGWNWGWGCCGWGWGWGFGWGWWGPGWSAWGPFWAWPPYYYTPWLDDSGLYGDASPAPYVLYPYPA